MSRKLPTRLVELSDKLFNAGIATGEQYASDCISIALYECGVSKSTIKEVMQKASRYGRQFAGSMDVKSDVEADVKQARMDARLQVIFEQDFVPYAQRYSYLKEVNTNECSTDACCASEPIQWLCKVGQPSQQNER